MYNSFNSTLRSAVTTACMVLLFASATRAEDPVKQYRQAAKEYAQRRWKFAVAEFQKFLRDHPQNPRAATSRFFLAESLIQLEEFEQAHEHFVQFLQDAPKHKYATQAHFRKGECSYLANRPAVAEKELEHFHDRFPEHPLNQFALSYLGELALAKKDYRVARDHFTQAIRQFPKGARRDHCRLGLGRCFVEEEKFAAAQPFFETLNADESSPLQHEGGLRLGMLLFQKGSYAAAAKQLHQVIKQAKRPVQVQAKYWLARSLLADKKAAAAIDQFEQLPFAQLDEEMAAAATLMLANAHRDLGNTTKAHQWYQKVWHKFPASAWAAPSLIGRMRLAIKEQNNDLLQELVQQFEKSYRTHPQWIDVQQLIGRNYLQQKRYGEAIDLFRRLLKDIESVKQRSKIVRTVAQTPAGSKGGPLVANAATTKAGTLFYLALALLKSAKYADVLNTLKEVDLSRLPDKLAADMCMAQAAALVSLKRYQQAIKPLRAYLAKTPQGEHAARCRAQLVVMLAHDGQVEKAHKQLLDLESSHPTEARLRLESMLFLAEVAYSHKQTELAKQLFEKLAEPTNPDKYIQQGKAGLAWSQLDQTKLARSASAFEDLIQQYPDSPLAAEAAVIRGNTLERLKQNDAALSSYLLVINNYPQSRQVAAAKLGAGRLLARRKQHAKASELLRSIRDDHPRFGQMDAALYELAWTMFDDNQPGQAFKVFQQLSDRYPESRFWADATLRTADYLRRSGKTGAALLKLKQLLKSKPRGNIELHALYLAGQLQAAKDDWRATAKSMDQVVRRFPLSSLRLPARYWVAEANFRLGNYDDASAQLRSILVQARSRQVDWVPMIELRQAQILAHKEEWTAAQEKAKNILQRFSRFSRIYEVHYLMGRCLASRGEYRLARTSYDNVIRSGTNTETAALAQWMIGETWFHQKKYSEAIEAYQRVIDVYQFPQWQAAALLQTGKCLEVQGEWDAARQAYARILKEFPKSRFARVAGLRLRVVRERAELASLPKQSSRN